MTYHLNCSLLLVIRRVRVSLHVIRLVRGVLMLARLLHVLRWRALLALLMWPTGSRMTTTTVSRSSTTVAYTRLTSIYTSWPVTTDTWMSAATRRMTTSTGLMAGPGGYLKARRCHMCSRRVCYTYA